LQPGHHARKAGTPLIEGGRRSDAGVYTNCDSDSDSDSNIDGDADSNTNA
jgi:hypothetical protein